MHCYAMDTGGGFKELPWEEHLGEGERIKAVFSSKCHSDVISRDMCVSV